MCVLAYLSTEADQNKRKPAVPAMAVKCKEVSFSSSSSMLATKSNKSELCSSSKFTMSALSTTSVHPNLTFSPL